MEVRSKTFEWDWKENGPDWGKVNEWIGVIIRTEGRPWIYQVETGMDSYAIVVADRKLLQEEADLCYDINN